MIKIKLELIDQIRRTSEEDPHYLMRILKRVPQHIRLIIIGLSADTITDLDAFTYFIYFCENGLDKFEVKPDMPSDYLDQVEEINKELHDLVRLCDFKSHDRMVTLIVLYRIFESELEVRSLET
jgi:hypothetical protein